MEGDVELRSANRVCLRRTFADGRIEEYELGFEGNRVFGDVPPGDTSVAGPAPWSDEIIIEWGK